MMINRLYKILMLSFVCLWATNISFAQELTRISGRIIDKNTKEALPFVNVRFIGKSIGTISDYDGKFSLETQWASNQIEITYLGYKKQIVDIKLHQSQKIVIRLESKNLELNEVLVTAKKKRYRNKNNPAVDLIRKVIEHKKKNRKENLSFYDYSKYEKVEFDINNITEKFRKRKIFNKFQFIFNYVDTSRVNGKPYLPFYLKETRSDVFYRKNPKTQREFVNGTRMVGFDDYIDDEGVGLLLDNLYQDIDLYDNNVYLLSNEFISPISTISPLIYKFHILDTLSFKGMDCVKLAFQPRNSADFAFKGYMLITTDNKYSVVNVDMKVSEDINLNFVNDVHISQHFEEMQDSIWMRTHDELVIDFNLNKKGIGLFGKKKVDYRNYHFNIQRADSCYTGLEKLVKLENYSKQGDEFWSKNRLSELSEQEQNIYVMTDSIKEMPAFKKTMDVIMLLMSGYWRCGKFDVGPVNTFYSFNDIEGFRLRLGGRTSDKFSERFMLEGYALYGFKDEKWKYSGKATWSLNKKALKENPKHLISAMYQVETNFPGMSLEFINEDNFLLSFKRGVADKILYYKQAQVEYFKDWGSGLSTTLNFKRVDQEAGGKLDFVYEDGAKVDNLIISELGLRVLFSPNGKFYQGVQYRVPIITRYPIFQVSYSYAFPRVFNSNYSYRKLKFNAFKRFYIAPFGYLESELETGKIFGSDVPFPLMFVHRANQTYSYQLRSYNLMNFLEFVSDEYVSLFLEQHFNGFFFNKIPLVKNLKLREIVSFKAIYGNVSDANNPANVNNNRMMFPTDDQGHPSTFTLQDKPYIEVSAGIGNIFKVFRVDLVRRVTYLDNPNTSEYGLRARFRLEF